RADATHVHLLSLLSLLSTPPLPPSTLSPYTTLFRSYSRRNVPARPSTAAPGPTCAGGYTPPPRGTLAGWAPPSRSWRWRNSASPDRKSTRLNSSHVSISYAVFCLKKKTLSILYTTTV